MANFQKINSKQASIYGGPGRLLVAPYGMARPEKLSDIIDLTTYEAKDGWRDVGATNDGIAVSRGFDTDDIEVDQSTEPVDQVITGFTSSLSTNLAEPTIDNRQLTWIGSQITDVPPVLGEPTTLSNPVAAGATVLTVAAVTGFTANGYLKLGDEVKKIAAVDAANTKITLKDPLTAAHEADAEVAPITELGYKKMSYGAPSEVPAFMVALLSLKKDGTLYGIVFYNCKVSGDDSETTFEKGQRLLPLQMNAHTIDELPEDQNVMIEFEQVI